MSVIANFSLPALDFPLGTALEVERGIKIRLESMVPTQDRVVPYFWTTGTDPEKILQTLEADDLIEKVELVDELDGKTLFRVEWATDVNGLLDTIATQDAIIMAANGEGDDWSFQLRFPDYDALSEFYRDAVSHDVHLDLQDVHNPVEPRHTSHYGLTPAQRETIQTALEKGYFDVPRDTTLVELGELMDLSDSAVSQRIRRGLTSLLSTTLLSDLAVQSDRLSDH